jgi:hypothetical protein
MQTDIELKKQLNYELSDYFVRDYCEKHDAVLYGVTLTSQKRYVHNARIWKASSLHARTEYVLDLFNCFEFVLNRFLDNNWKRRANKPFFVHAAVENFAKREKEQDGDATAKIVSPHIHGIALVDRSYEARLQGLITREFVQLDLLSSTDPWIAVKPQIDSVKLTPLLDEKRLFLWTTYAFQVQEQGETKLIFNTKDRAINTRKARQEEAEQRRD